MSEDAADGQNAPHREESTVADGRTADARPDGPFDALADARSRTARYHGAPVGSWFDRVDAEGCR